MAEKYYKDYFGEFGAALTRTIKRTVKAALEREASRNSESPVTDLVHMPLAVSDDKRQIEGVFAVTAMQKGRKIAVRRAFVATLDLESGAVLSVVTEASR